MVFLIPDAEDYNATRGGVIEYDPTAPGPHLISTDDVVSALKDLDALRRDYADARARFRASYLDLEDGCASRRLVDAVMGSRGDA